MTPLDHCYVGATDTLEIGISPTIKALFTTFDRKLSTSGLSVGVEYCKSINEIIESTAEIVGKLPYKDSDFSRNTDYRRLPHTRPYDEIACIGVMIGEQSILIFLRDSRDSLPQISKVFFGPMHTKEAAMKAVTGCDTFHG